MKKKNSKFYKVSEVKISYHNKIKLSESPQITCSKDAADIFYANWSDDMDLIESFNILFLNRANKVKGIFTVSKGGIAGTVVDAKIIFAAALKALASSIILGHNHPSGNRRASKADIEITKKLVKAGELLEMPVLDHLLHIWMRRIQHPYPLYY